MTVTVHELLAGTVPPESATLAPPLAAVTTPPHVVAPLALAVFTRPAGYVSVNAAPVIAVAFGLVSVMVSTDALLVPIEAGVNDFATESAVATVSVSLADAVFAPPFAVVSAPAAIVLVWLPDVLLVTFTVTVHEPPAGIVAPESATLLPLLAAVTVPPTHVVAPLAAAVLVTVAG